MEIDYADSVSFLFPHFENGLSSISLPKTAPELHNLKEILSNTATLINYETAMNDPRIRSAFEQHCPNIQKEQIMGPDSIK